MPFGLTNAPATLQRALDIILSGLKWQICLVCLDNVIIFSANTEQHFKDVDTVLHRLPEAGVTLNLEKCTWFSDEVEYLGHIVRLGQLHVHNKNVDALKHVPNHKDPAEKLLGHVQRLSTFRQGLWQTSEAPERPDSGRHPTGSTTTDRRGHRRIRRHSKSTIVPTGTFLAKGQSEACRRR